MRKKGKAATASHSSRRLFSHSCEAASNVFTPSDARADTFSARPSCRALYARLRRSVNAGLCPRHLSYHPDW